ncbi:MAG: toll/interleukin-1 receptor domain-containing protein [Acidobacteriota bacterium]|nr:toll/interleukin-1 receptor domain-containing protein [Acidobacteriota bacterium]
MTVEELGRLIERSLKRSAAVEIDGLGVFARSSAGDISFERSSKPRVFIAYAVEDRAASERLYDELTARGISAWLDRRKLLPGQEWPQRLEDAIASSDFFLACFSKRSVNKRGAFQAELRYALDCANRMPLDDVFLLPARLDECRIPTRIHRQTQYVDLFPDWPKGLERILKIIDRQTRRTA